MIAAIFVNDKTELTNQRPASTIREGKSLIGQKYNRADQWSSRDVREGMWVQKMAGDRAYWKASLQRFNKVCMYVWMHECMQAK